MDLQELQLRNLGIDTERFRKIFSFVDFGNVNYWYGRDRHDWDGNVLSKEQRLIVDISKLARFLDFFSEQKRFYYGWHQRIKRSWHIAVLAEKNGFIKITKPIQFIKHYLDEIEQGTLKSRFIKEDAVGKYIEIPKSNFDVEISIDAIRLMEKYDTFCLLSGDSDFAKLTQFLKKRGKQVILIAAGQIFYTLKDFADLYINAQKIKASIARIKTSPQ